MGNSAGGGIRRKNRKKWMKQFNLTEADVEHELRRFKKMANKEGVITKAQYFEIVSSRMSAFGEDMLQAVFRSMDLDGDGTIDVNEWVAVAGLTAKGSVGDRLAASFRMFDEDGNGELSVAEVEAMFMRIAKVAEGGVLSDDAKADTKEVIRQIFLRFDTDKSGSLSLEEFQAGFAADPAICRYFKQF